MARIIGNEYTKLSWAEEMILGFLVDNKGKEFTPQEIEKEVGIRANFVDPIMDNLRWKGFEVGSRNGKHFFIHNTIWAYVTGGSIFAAMFLILLFSYLGYFG